MHHKSKRHQSQEQAPCQYPDVPSAIKLASHGSDIPVPEPNVAMESSSDSESSDITDTAECGAYRPEEDD